MRLAQRVKRGVFFDNVVVSRVGQSDLRQHRQVALLEDTGAKNPKRFMLRRAETLDEHAARD